jgi:hypothetical protein
MINKNKIRAFTMMDILTGMVVMSIVIAMVFYILPATNRQVFLYGEVRMRLNEYLLMKADLERHVDGADRIEEVPAGFCLIDDSKSVTYFNNGGNLLRHSGNEWDTLCNSITGLVLTKSAPYPEPNISVDLVTAITIKLKFREQVLSCYFHKDYGISQPVNQLLIREL